MRGVIFLPVDKCRHCSRHRFVLSFVIWKVVSSSKIHRSTLYDNILLYFNNFRFSAIHAILILSLYWVIVDGGGNGEWRMFEKRVRKLLFTSLPIPLIRPVKEAELRCYVCFNNKHKYENKNKITIIIPPKLCSGINHNNNIIYLNVHLFLKFNEKQQMNLGIQRAKLCIL